MVLAKALEMAGISHSLFHARLRIGWSEEQALTEPKRAHGRLTEEMIGKITKDKRNMRYIAEEYGVGLTTVWRIKRGLAVRAAGTRV